MHRVSNNEPTIFKASSDSSLTTPRLAKTKRTISHTKIVAAKINGSINKLLNDFPPNARTKTNHKKIGAPLAMTKLPVGFFRNSHNATASPNTMGIKYSTTGVNKRTKKAWCE